MAMNRIQFQPGLSMPEFLKLFGTAALCSAALENGRWPDGFRCPGCGGAQRLRDVEYQCLGMDVLLYRMGYERARSAFDRLAEEVDYLTRQSKWMQNSKEIEAALKGQSNDKVTGEYLWDFTTIFQKLPIA